MDVFRLEAEHVGHIPNLAARKYIEDLMISVTGWMMRKFIARN